MKSALQGEVAAQFNLANMYYLGKGVERDWGQAEKWCRRAVAQGHWNAKKFLFILEHKLQMTELDSCYSISPIAE